jgi:hypothetical protein
VALFLAHRYGGPNILPQDLVLQPKPSKTKRKDRKGDRAVRLSYLIHVLFYTLNIFCGNIVSNFHIRTVQQLDIIRVLFFHQLMY